MKKVLRFTFAFGLMLVAEVAMSQMPYTTSGKSDTACTQSDSVTLTCTTVTKLTLPAGVNLTNMSLPVGIATGPACTGLTATPSSQIPVNIPTTISLGVNGCPTSSAYIYSWATPVSAATGSTTSHNVVLSTSAPSQTYSISVCFTSNPGACSTYSATVIAAAPVPALAGCSASAASSSITQGGTNTLTVNCSSGTAAGANATYQWYRGSALIPNATVATYAVPGTETATVGTLTYSVQIKNDAPSTASPTPSISFAVTAPVAAVTDYCPSSPVRLTFNASESYRKIYSSQYASTPPGGFFVVAIDVTATDSTIGRYLAEIGYSDFGSTRSGRYVTVSKSKCDFTETAQWISINTGGVKYDDNAGGGTISMGGADSRLYTAKLTPGRWYLNIQNPPGSCPANVSSCDVVIGWAN